MKRLLAVLLTALFLLSLFGCTAPSIPEPTVEENLSTLLSDHKDIPVHSIEGKIFLDGKLTSTVTAKTNLVGKEITLIDNGVEYIYYGTYLMKKDGDYVIAKSNTNYATILSTYLPFVIDDFSFSVNNCGDIKRMGDVTVIEFYNEGGELSFPTDLDLSGGVLTVTEKDGVITESTFSSTVTEKGVSLPVYAHYVYQTADNVIDVLPWIRPTDSVDYLTYAMDILVDKYAGYTLRTMANKIDTGVSLGALPIDAKLIKDVKIISLEDNFSLFFEYSTKQIVVGLSSTINNITVTFNREYSISTLVVNEGARYELQKSV